MQESQYFSQKLSAFIFGLNQSFVDGIKFNIDAEPAFSKSEIPFNFEYCDSILFKTDQGAFSLSTAMTSHGFETLLVEKSENLQILECDFLINSKVVSTDIKRDDLNYAYRIDLVFEKNELAIFAGEIYESDEGHWYGTLPDEMILVFHSIIDANKFQRLTNYA